MLGNRRGLVRLNWPYKVPSQMKIFQCGHFLEGFLQVTFAKMHEATGVGDANIVCEMAFAGSNHKNVTIVILAFTRAAPYSLEQICYIVREWLFVHDAHVNGLEVCGTRE